ncbi:MAG: CotH kinase family protein [Planctomycetota bacterium]|nr:CotH kinase family protein [Planctomycetota bacterium]
MNEALFSSRTSWLTLAGLALVGILSTRLHAQLRINEFQTSNRLTALDEEGDSSDWLELYNAGGTALDLEGYTLSDDGQAPRKWRIPDVSIEAGARLIVWCSGKDRTSPTKETIEQRNSPLPFSAGIVTRDVEWRYLTGAPEDPGPPPEWMDPGFDDATWGTGLPGFGFGEDDIRTQLPRGMGTVFLRHFFQLEDPDSLPNLVLRAVYDDGFVVYLNGQRVLDVNYREETDPTFASRASRSVEKRDERFDLTAHRELLRPGENLLAIALLNITTTNRDLRLIPELGTVPRILHTNFRLNQDGERLLVADPSGDLLDAVIFPRQSTDRSYGRFPDGAGSFFYMLFPSPGEPNDEHVAAELLPDELSAEPNAGKLTRETDVVLLGEIPFAGFEIRYTRNGSTPSASSSLYEGPIHVDRDSVIRAAGFLDGEPVTRVLTKSYFLGGNIAPHLTLPIISIAMNPRDFSFIHNSTDGRGRRFERAAHMEVFDGDGQPQVATGFGLRLHGGAGRGGSFNVKKAYKAYFRRIYGDRKLRFRLLPDTEVEEFDKLVLRSNFNDAFRTGGEAALIRDQLIRDLHKEMGATVSHGSWYNLFVNMRYRGVYNVVERMDRKFLESYFPEDGDNWDVIKTGGSVLDGDGREWSQLLSFFRTGDFSDDQLYEQALERIAVEEFTSYMILNIWAQNHDWPHNNWYAVRPRRTDGQWTFLSWDAEFGIGRVPSGYSSDTFQHVFSRGDAPASIILRGLLENRRYREFFVDELDRHLEATLNPENVIAHIDRLSVIIEPDMPMETRVAGGNVTAWRRNIESTRVFARGRNNQIRNHVLRSNRFSFPSVIGAIPRRITQEGEVDIRLRTVRATEATQVFFEDIPSPRVEFRSSRELLVTVPFDPRLEGFPSITVADPERGRSTSRGLLEIRFLRPSVRTIEPGTGSALGGDVVTITGSDFTEGVRVEFGGVPSPSVSLTDDSGETLQVVTPPGRGTVKVAVINTRPQDSPAAQTLEFTYEGPDALPFVRGDADANGRVNIADAVVILRYLTRGDVAPSCEDALDGDDSGIVNLTDAIFLLNHLFRPGSSAPASPFPGCGEDGTKDSLTCASACAN